MRTERTPGNKKLQPTLPVDLYRNIVEYFDEQLLSNNNEKAPLLCLFWLHENWVLKQPEFSTATAIFLLCLEVDHGVGQVTLLRRIENKR